MPSHTFAKLPVHVLINDPKKMFWKKLYVTIPEWFETFPNMSDLWPGRNRAKCGLQLNDPIDWLKLRLSQPKMLLYDTWLKVWLLYKPVHTFDVSRKCPAAQTAHSAGVSRSHMEQFMAVLPDPVQAERENDNHKDFFLHLIYLDTLNLKPWYLGNFYSNSWNSYKSWRFPTEL